MNSENIRTKAAIDELARRSHMGELDFGTVVAELTKLGAEAYFADYRRGETTYYLRTDAVHVVPLYTPELAIADAFGADAVRAAIHGSQRGEVKYPEFVRRTMAAGCVGYFVWIAGRHVRYFGRRGESHVEDFPS